MTVIAKNVSGFTQSFLSTTIPDNQQVIISNYYTAEEIANSLVLQALISVGDIVINNGFNDLTPVEAFENTFNIKTVNGIAGTDITLDPDDFDDSLTINKFLTIDERDKLSILDENATDDQTGAEIAVALFAELDTNNFDDAALARLIDAVVNADTSTANMAFVIDEDSFVSNSDTKVPTQQSTKQFVVSYVAAAIIGAKDYIGGYDAAINFPNLMTPPPVPELGSVKRGSIYDVTVAGLLFTHELEIGDTITANQDNPSTAAHWVVTQSNLTAASIKTNYESNPNTNAFTDAQEVKVDFISVTQAVDLDTVESNSAASKVITDFITVTQAVNLDTIETNSDASKVITDFITITQAVNLDTVESDVLSAKTKTDFISVTQAVNLDTMESDIALNNAKVSNVPTALSIGTQTGTTLDIDSDGGAADVTLPQAVAGGNAGLLSGADQTKLNNTTNINSGDQTSIVGITGTKAEFDTALTDGNFIFVGDAPTAHTHLLAAGATDVTMTAANLNTLDDGVDSTLHFHDSDRNRANHTGTQLAATISDFDTEVSNNTAVAANTAKVTNVPTALSIGAQTGTTLAIDSDGGANDVILPQVIASGNAGLMSGTDKALLDTLGANLFGTEQGYSESTGISTNGTTTYATKVTHIIPSAAPTGIYYVNVVGIMYSGATNTTMGVIFQNGAVTVEGIVQHRSNNADSREAYNRTFRVSHTSGVDTELTLEFAQVSGGGITEFSEARIQRWRIS